jgi:hypothetical protein
LASVRSAYFAMIVRKQLDGRSGHD